MSVIICERFQALISTYLTGGSVSLKSTNPFEEPLLDLGLFQTASDISITVESFKSAQRLVTAPAWKEFTLDRLAPPPEIQTDEELAQFIRDTSAVTSHGVGTAAMSSKRSTWGVVDPDLRVKGISGLRIVDASVIVSNTIDFGMG